MKALAFTHVLKFCWKFLRFDWLSVLTLAVYCPWGYLLQLGPRVYLFDCPKIFRKNISQIFFLRCPSSRLQQHTSSSTPQILQEIRLYDEFNVRNEFINWNLNSASEKNWRWHIYGQHLTIFMSNLVNLEEKFINIELRLESRKNWIINWKKYVSCHETIDKV